MYRKTDCFLNTPAHFVSCHVYGYGEISSFFDKNAAMCAAERGHIDCLRNVREQKNCPCGEDTVLCAAGNIRLACLRYARKNGCPWHRNVCGELLDGCKIWIPPGRETSSTCDRCGKNDLSARAVGARRQ